MNNFSFNQGLCLRFKPLARLCTALLFLPFNALSAEKPPISVIAYQVQQITQTNQISALGNLQAQNAVQVAANVTETIQAIHFEDGQNVLKDQLLVELDNREELALLAEASATVNESKLQYQRVKDVVSRGSVTQSLVDEKYGIWQTAKANRQVVQARLADRRIVAPFSGQLGFSNLSVGALITPGTQIVSLDDNSVMKLNLFVATEFLSALNIGQTVIVRSAAFPNLDFQGQISAISPRLEQNLRMIKVIALIDNSKRQLKSNMMVEVYINLPDKQQLIVPNTALIMLGDHQYIYRLTKQNNVYQAEKIEVQTGEVGETYTEITTGLNAGDLVVSQGVMRVKHKARVQIKALQGSMLQEELLQANPKSAVKITVSLPEKPPLSLINTPFSNVLQAS
jgi:membrane fusion protein (multidrug efflux system)